MPYGFIHLEESRSRKTEENKNITESTVFFTS